MTSRSWRWQIVLVGALGLLYLLPLVWMVLTSFKTDAEVRSAPNELFFSPTLTRSGRSSGPAVPRLSRRSRWQCQSRCWSWSSRCQQRMPSASG